MRNEEFTRAWREHIRIPAGMESFTITSRKSGPPGRDINVRLNGSDATTLKNAALELEAALEAIPGVSETQDDMPYGREQLIYGLTPAGEALGLTVAELGQQLRSAFDGRLVQIFQDGPDEIEVRVQLPKADRDRLSSLQRINIRTPAGDFVPLATVAQLGLAAGFRGLASRRRALGGGGYRRCGPRGEQRKRDHGWSGSAGVAGTGRQIRYRLYLRRPLRG